MGNCMSTVHNPSGPYSTITAGTCKLSNGQPGACSVNYNSYTVTCCGADTTGGLPNCEDSSVQADCSMHSVTANEGKRCLFLRNSGGYGKCEAGGCKQSADTAPTGSASGGSGTGTGKLKKTGGAALRPVILAAPLVVET